MKNLLLGSFLSLTIVRLPTERFLTKYGKFFRINKLYKRLSGVSLTWFPFMPVAIYAAKRHITVASSDLGRPVFGTVRATHVPKKTLSAASFLSSTIIGTVSCQWVRRTSSEFICLFFFENLFNKFTKYNKKIKPSF